MTRQLDALNDLARPFLRDAVFVMTDGGRLMASCHDSGQPGQSLELLSADLSRQRNWFRFRRLPATIGLGGTDEQTLCQLILWWRELPRLPARVLAYWQERDRDFVTALARHGYEDAKSTQCVLCGQPPDGLDWWSLGNVTGPSCLYGRCRDKETKGAL